MLIFADNYSVIIWPELSNYINANKCNHRTQYRTFERQAIRAVNYMLFSANQPTAEQEK